MAMSWRYSRANVIFWGLGIFSTAASVFVSVPSRSAPLTWIFGLPNFTFSSKRNKTSRERECISAYNRSEGQKLQQNDRVLLVLQLLHESTLPGNWSTWNWSRSTILLQSSCVYCWILSALQNCPNLYRIHLAQMVSGIRSCEKERTSDLPH